MNKKAAEQQRAVRSMETPEQYSEFEDSVIEAAKTQAQRIIDDARRQGDANFDKLMEGHRGDPLIPYREEAKNRLARKMASVKQDNRKKRWRSTPGHPLMPSAWRTRWPGVHRKFPANARCACAVPTRRCWPPW